MVSSFIDLCTQSTRGSLDRSVAMIRGQGPFVIALAGAFMGLNTFFIALRCYTKARISKNFNYNDVGMITVLVNQHVVASLESAHDS